MYGQRAIVPTLTRDTWQNPGIAQVRGLRVLPAIRKYRVVLSGGKANLRSALFSRAELSSDLSVPKEERCKSERMSAEGLFTRLLPLKSRRTFTRVNLQFNLMRLNVIK